MENDRILELRDELIRDLKYLVEQSEAVYLDLGKDFPVLLDEMDRSLSQSDAFVSSLEENFQADSGGGHTIRRTMERTTALVAKTHQDFTVLHQEDHRVLEAIEERIKRLSNMSQTILVIHRDSQAMELISLNALVLGIKAGSSGRAFSYITEVLKRLSNHTTQLSESTIQRGRHLLKLFTAFRSSMQETRATTDRLFRDFQTRLSASFEDFQAVIADMSASLRRIVTRSAGIRAPLLRIMEGIQQHDIIRQSIDHVILSLNELRDTTAGKHERETLDELIFIRSLPVLCRTLLEEIEQGMRQGLAAFKDHIVVVRALVNGLENDRASFVDDGGGSAAIEDLFRASIELLQTLIDDMGSSLRLKERLQGESGRLMSEVLHLEQAFKSFETVVSRFKSIDIASRIEVAKQPVLRKMTGTVEEMNELTTRIEADVAAALQETKTFIAATGDTLAGYGRVLKKEEVFIQIFAEEIRSCYASLDQAKTAVTAELRGFSVYTDRFFHLLGRTEERLSRMEDLVQKIGKIKTGLQEIASAAQLRLDPYREQLASRSWSIENSRLKAIIERFTIFSHKRAAGDFGGFDVEAGSPAGHVTFF